MLSVCSVNAAQPAQRARPTECLVLLPVTPSQAEGSHFLRRLVPPAESAVLLCQCAGLCSSCVWERINAWVTVPVPTCVRSHFSVISYGPETLGSRSCEGDGDGRSSTFQINFPLLCRVRFKSLNIEHTHTHTHTRSLTLRPRALHLDMQHDHS